jgi:hypothetical protein
MPDLAARRASLRLSAASYSDNAASCSMTVGVKLEEKCGGQAPALRTNTDVDGRTAETAALRTNTDVDGRTADQTRSADLSIPERARHGARQSER